MAVEPAGEAGWYLSTRRSPLEALLNGVTSTHTVSWVIEGLSDIEIEHRLGSAAEKRWRRGPRRRHEAVSLLEEDGPLTPGNGTFSVTLMSMLGVMSGRSGDSRLLGG